jgi:hypothetical protein
LLFFGEAEDFQAALSADGVAGLLVTGRGQFRARVTHVGLEAQGLALPAEALEAVAAVPLLPLITDCHVDALTLPGTIEEVADHLVALTRAGIDGISSDRSRLSAARLRIRSSPSAPKFGRR